MGLAAFVGVLLMSAMVLVSADVSGRFFFGRPIAWGLEVTEYILLYTPFLGMAWLVRLADGHVRIDVLTQALPHKAQALLDGLMSLLATLACGLGTYYGVLTAWDHYVRGIETFAVLPVPKYALIIVIPFGLSLTAIEFARRAYRALSGLGRESPED